MTDKQQPHQSPRWIALALVVSLGVHGLLAWLAAGTLEKREREPRSQRISLIVRDKAIPPTPSLEPQRAHAVDRQPPAGDHQPTAEKSTANGSHGKGPLLDFPGMPSERTALPGPQLGTLPTNSGTSGTNGSTQGSPNGSQDRVELFHSKAIDKTAGSYSKPNESMEGSNLPQRGELTEQERVQAALDRMLTEQAAIMHAEKLVKAPPELATLQAALDGAFNPPAESVAASRLKDKAVAHEQGHLVTLLDVSRSADDKEPTIVVSQPSGDNRFDDAAVLAMKQSLKGLTSCNWSRWRFTAEVYRFSRSEMLLDPGFKPPGRRIASSSGAMSMTTSVRLLSFR